MEVQPVLVDNAFLDAEDNRARLGASSSDDDDHPQAVRAGEEAVEGVKRTPSGKETTIGHHRAGSGLSAASR